MAAGSAADCTEVIACVMRASLVLVVVAACSSGHPNQPAPTAPSARPASPTPPPPSSTPPPKARSAISAEVFCHRFAKLTSECEWFAKLRLPGDDCVIAINELLASKHPSSQSMALVRCVVEGDGCDDTSQCLTLELEDPAANGAELRACHDGAPPGALVAVGVPRPEWERRNGAGVTAYHAARSTRAAPIEMCGVSAANRWLSALHCDDGSHPIASPVDSERARTGSVGEGGRCGSIIDLYTVPCPEARYEIFIDAYICPRPE